ncbi:hypothetical protein [Arsenicicoccus dermatophilus]|uniref:hypothetical protein n=1 Tax=Arsenicicoccus dermatophilus TaxID=1076331 RepID=UPI0039172875
MTDNHEIQDAKDEAVDTVVERVESWNDGAEKDTVAEELRKGFDEAEVDVPESDVDQLAEQIHTDGKAATEGVRAD